MYLLDTDANPSAPRYRGRPQKPLLLLQEFLRRNRQTMEVVFTRFDYKDAGSCRATFAKAIKYYHLERYVAVRVSGRKVYLVRLNPKQEESL